MRTLGYIFVGLIIFVVGYWYGQTPTEAENQAQATKDETARDILDVGVKYEKVYNLCEEKFETYLNGEYYDAVRLNGQIDVLIGQIDIILDKYDTTAL